MATAGETYFYLGGARCGVHAYTALMPNSLHHTHSLLLACSHTLPNPFPHVLWCTKHVLSHVMTCQAHPTPYIYSGTREDEALQTFPILGIVHALYIKYATHNTTLFYISIASNKKYKALHLFTLI